ncbi:TonB-dependent receptor plug domain-containing protein [Flavobacterium algicola]|uniref:TonB-dependent receptor plug domain-containing protein n=1 Tax=Flavobacterium algicola TaxID=556529 RepID=UPI001EFE2673|nr:TonB-dependent receptor [Flavobacterium algicola]MCG9794160.1 TonB-dependent receptor [Flavobacterium algicola]
MKLTIFLFITTTFFLNGLAQATADKKLTELAEVVVTGQLEPQSISKSVFNVRLITSSDIQNLAANNLADVLNQYLNISVRPSGNDGRSTVSLFGLDAQYFKILVDNVPLVSETGLGNNTDLSQINLDDVAQIEIIEGSMGVTHGANAVSGVLNIITKKSSKTKWSIVSTIQEESVGSEFALFDKGRHIQSLRVSHSIDKNWFVSLGANRNDFQGYLDLRKGKNYAENDSFRGYQWLPKVQLNTTALVSFHKNDFRMFYKFEFLDENVDFYNSTIQSGYNSILGSYRYALDKRYLTNRYFHNLNVTGKIASGLNYNVSISHQKQQRNIEDFRYYLATQNETNNAIEKDQAMEVLYSTGTISNFFPNSIANLQLGYEFSNNLGFSLVQEENNIEVPISKRLKNYDAFAVSEIKATERFSFRPGFRYSMQSQFDNQYATSLGLRYLFDRGIEVRGSVGNSFRTPAFEELYSKQIFDGHHFTGNENLIPETSSSYEMSFKKTTVTPSGSEISTTVTTSFLDVKDRIDMALVRFNLETGNPEYEYININKYQMWNISSMNQFRKENWAFNMGASLIGVSQQIDNQVFVSDDSFLYSFNLNANISYGIPKWKTFLAAYYKYNGRTQRFVAGSSQYVLSELDASNWLDATIRKEFFVSKINATIGVRNLFDITNSNQTTANESGGHASPTQIMLAYGRSYFVKLTYNLNF